MIKVAKIVLFWLTVPFAGILIVSLGVAAFFGGLFTRSFQSFKEWVFEE